MQPWLIRTSANEILGPFPKEEVLKRVREGSLGPEDEVCAADGYWIYLDEREEVKKQLGVEPPQPVISREDDEITETETLTQEVPAVQKPSPVPAQQPKPFVLGRVEKTSLWPIIATILVVITGLLFAVLLRVLQTSR